MSVGSSEKARCRTYYTENDDSFSLKKHIVDTKQILITLIFRTSTDSEKRIDQISLAIGALTSFHVCTSLLPNKIYGLAQIANIADKLQQI